jgi:hypothetical protein
VKLAFALLADYAQVDNGKVHIIGGGVSILWRHDYPAGVGVTVVAGFDYNNVEAGSSRPLRLQINDADGNALAPPLEAEFNLPPRAQHAPTSVPLQASFAVAIAPNVPLIPAPGNYVIELMMDGNHVASLPFAAAEPPGQPDGETPDH